MFQQLATHLAIPVSSFVVTAIPQHLQGPTEIVLFVALVGMAVAVSLIYGSDGAVTAVHSAEDLGQVLNEIAGSGERLLAVFDHAPVGIGLIDSQGRFVQINRALATIYGREIHALIGNDAFDFAHPDERADSLAIRHRLLSGESDRIRVQRRLLRPDGTEIVVDMESVADRRGDHLHLLAIVLDITTTRRSEERLSHLALHDPLTSLPNRTLLLDRLSMAVRRARREKSILAVLFIDLDRFKILNDSLGHDLGDRVLQTVAARLQQVIRINDTVARFGGDEFVVLAEFVENDDVLDLARRVQDVLDQPVLVGEREFSMSASIGIATSDRTVDPEDLLRDADTAMYEAKLRGRNRTAVYDDVLRERAVARMETEQALRQALCQGELRLVYQPQISMDDGTLVGVEALLRWEHPIRGMVGPGQFLEIAAEIGLMGELTGFVLEEATRQAVEWRCASPDEVVPTISVNVASQDVANGNLPARVLSLLHLHDLSPNAIQIELTEQAVLSDLAEARATMLDLQRFGVAVGLDDFGTGYSSLAYLRELPLSFLKIDRSFVSGTAGLPGGDDILVPAIVQLAHNLGLTAIAEGVERSEQLDLLRAVGCDSIQGYQVARPMKPSQLYDWLDRRSIKASPTSV